MLYIVYLFEFAILAGMPNGTSRSAARVLNDLLATVLRGRTRELSLTASSTLATLERTGPRRITELSAIEGVTQPSMTILIGNMKRKGLVDRLSDPQDRRVTLASITPGGFEYLRRRRAANCETLERLIDQLDDDDRAALDAALGALSRLLQLKEDERDPAYARG